MRAAALVFVFSVLALAAVAGADTITGRASFYGEAYRGRLMANGAPFDPDALTAASWDFPLGSRVRVTHGGREVVVTITDRGPARRLRQRGRVLDLSDAAFVRLAPTRLGLIAVAVTLEPGGRRNVADAGR